MLTQAKIFIVIIFFYRKLTPNEVYRVKITVATYVKVTTRRCGENKTFAYGIGPQRKAKLKKF